MSVKNIVAHVVGVAAIAGGATWLALDVKGDGHVVMSTAIGSAALGTLGGWLIDKVKTREFLAFLLEQVRAFLPSAGSVTQK